MSGIIHADALGIAFVSDDVPNAAKIETLISLKSEELIEKAQTEMDAYLDSLGLENVMGVIVTKGSIPK